MTTINDNDWEDALPGFQDAIKDLKVGQLVHSSDFSVDSATHSLEILNPKLDSSVGCEYLSMTPQLLYLTGEIPKDTTLSIQQTVVLFDRLMSLEVGWMEGNPISFTLLNCMYLHVPSLLKSKYIEPYIKLLLASSDTIFQIVSRGDICLEEDFNLSTFDFDFTDAVKDTVQLVKIITAIEKDLQQELGKLDQTSNEYFDLLDLFDRLSFRKSFHVVMYSLLTQNLELTTKSIVNLQTNIEALKKRANKRPSFDTLPKGIFNEQIINQTMTCMKFPTYEPHPFPKVVDIYDKIVLNILTMFKMPHLVEYYKAKHDREQLEQQKQQKQQQQQQQQQNNQNKKSKNQQKNNNNNNNAPKQQQQLSKPLELSELRLLDILDFHMYFSRQSPNIIVRSVMRRLLFPIPDGSFFRVNDLSQAMINWMHEFGIPHGILSKSVPQFNVFVERLCLVYLKVLIHLALNRARQRRKLKVSLMDFCILQNEADMLDQMVLKDNRPVFGSFILYFKLKIMTLFLSLGFELDIYSPYEYQMIYWYQDCLTNVGITVQHYIHNYTQNQLLKQKAEKQSKKNSKKGGKSPTNQQPQQVNELPPVNPERLLIQINRLMSRAYFRILTVLEMKGKIIKPKGEFSTPELRFWKRFEHFNNPPGQQPEPLTLDMFNSAIDVKDNTGFSILRATLELTRQIKSSLEQLFKFENLSSSLLDEGKLIQKANISLSLFLLKILPKDYESIPETTDVPLQDGKIMFDLKNPYYPIIQLK